MVSGTIPFSDTFHPLRVESSRCVQGHAFTRCLYRIPAQSPCHLMYQGISPCRQCIVKSSWMLQHPTCALQCKMFPEEVRWCCLSVGMLFPLARHEVEHTRAYLKSQRSLLCKTTCSGTVPVSRTKRSEELPHERAPKRCRPTELGLRRPRSPALPRVHERLPQAFQ
eukprot:scaffold659_cov329-Prasinococcus_capsulatus_cf.AAC.23